MWINGFENRYEITRDGKVFFHKDGKRRERKLVPDKDGYMTINIKIKGKVYCKKIHREVGKAYIEPFNGEHINHINGIKHDNRVENLEWCTNLENNKHMRDNGLKRVGVKYVNNSTGFYGVVNQGSKFCAQLKRGGRHIHLGIFDSPEEAYNIVSVALKQELDGLKIKEYKHIKKIYQIDDDNNIVNEYKSIAEAERMTGIANQEIGRVILGKIKKAGGYSWKRISKDVYI